jgi:flavodoxin/ferredoxin
MIFYFSGTGNSLYVARNIAQYNNEELISVSSVINRGSGLYEFTLKQDEIIGFVYPVYAWGPPKMVLELIHKLKLNNYVGNYIFSVVTCGDNVGNAMPVIERHLNKKSLALNSGFSIQMPNNYIISYDVDSAELEKAKLDRAEITLNSINNIVRSRTTGVFELEKGPLPWLLTGIVNPLFVNFAVDTKHFWTNDECIGCGICEKVCNCKNIKVEGTPHWGKRCSQCLACIHFCPQKAIQYGKATEGKGRYTNPNVSIKESFLE